MYSRRKFLMGLLWAIPFVFAPTKLLSNHHDSPYTKRREKFIKQGWVLQEGDV